MGGSWLLWRLGGLAVTTRNCKMTSSVLVCQKKASMSCKRMWLFLFSIIQVAYLEKLRADKLRDSCIMIQKNFRCWREHRLYLRMRQSAILIQAWLRGYLARRFVDKFMSVCRQKFQTMSSPRFVDTNNAFACCQCLKWHSYKRCCSTESIKLLDPLLLVLIQVNKWWS